MLGKAGAIPGTRELIPHESYRLVYEISGDTVWILTLVHTARRWPPFAVEQIRQTVHFTRSESESIRLKLPAAGTSMVGAQFEGSVHLCIHCCQWITSGIRPRRPRTSRSTMFGLLTLRFHSRIHWACPSQMPTLRANHG